MKPIPMPHVRYLSKLVLFALAEQRIGRQARVLGCFFHTKHGLEIR